MAQQEDYYKLQSVDFHADVNKSVWIKRYRHADRHNEFLKHEQIELKNCGTQINKYTKKINNRIVWTNKQVCYADH